MSSAVITSLAIIAPVVVLLLSRKIWYQAQDRDWWLHSYPATQFGSIVVIILMTMWGLYGLVTPQPPVIDIVYITRMIAFIILYFIMYLLIPWMTLLLALIVLIEGIDRHPIVTWLGFALVGISIIAADAIWGGIEPLTATAVTVVSVYLDVTKVVFGLVNIAGFLAGGLATVIVSVWQELVAGGSFMQHHVSYLITSMVARLEAASGLTLEYLGTLLAAGGVIGMFHVLIPWVSDGRTAIQQILGSIGPLFFSVGILIGMLGTLTTTSQMWWAAISYTSGLGIGVQLTHIVVKPIMRRVGMEEKGKPDTPIF